MSELTWNADDNPPELFVLSRDGSLHVTVQHGGDVVEVRASVNGDDPVKGHQRPTPEDVVNRPFLIAIPTTSVSKWRMSELSLECARGAATKTWSKRRTLLVPWRQRAVAVACAFVGAVLIALCGPFVLSLKDTSTGLFLMGLSTSAFVLAPVIDVIRARLKRLPALVWTRAPYGAAMAVLGLVAFGFARSQVVRVYNHTGNEFAIDDGVNFPNRPSSWLSLELARHGAQLRRRSAEILPLGRLPDCETSEFRPELSDVFATVEILSCSHRYGVTSRRALEAAGIDTHALCGDPSTSASDQCCLNRYPSGCDTDEHRRQFLSSRLVSQRAAAEPRPECAGCVEGQRTSQLGFLPDAGVDLTNAQRGPRWIRVRLPSSFSVEHIDRDDAAVGWDAPNGTGSWAIDLNSATDTAVSIRVDHSTTITTHCSSRATHLDLVPTQASDPASWIAGASAGDARSDASHQWIALCHDGTNDVSVHVDIVPSNLTVSEVVDAIASGNHRMAIPPGTRRVEVAVRGGSSLGTATCDTNAPDDWLELVAVEGPPEVGVQELRDGSATRWAYAAPTTAARSLAFLCRRMTAGRFEPVEQTGIIDHHYQAVALRGSRLVPTDTRAVLAHGVVELDPTATRASSPAVCCFSDSHGQHLTTCPVPAPRPGAPGSCSTLQMGVLPLGCSAAFWCAR